MRTLIITLLLCSVAFRASADLDASLLRDIGAWRKGAPPPARLLKFPDGKVDAQPRCGLRVWGDSVSDYIGEIKDADLLVALIFDRRAGADSWHASVRQLIRLKGLAYLVRLLNEKRGAEPLAFGRPELAVLTQLLHTPYVGIKVAHISPEDMKPGKAEEVLGAMKVELEAGKAWPTVYRAFADRHPDMRDRAQNPRSVGTFVCYLYHGLVSPGGFDILDYSIAEDLPLGHLRELFRARHGTHVFKTGKGVYLYHIESYFSGAA